MPVSVRATEAVRPSVLIDGAWSAGEETLEVHNPATGQALTPVAAAGAAEAEHAIDAAAGALPEWRTTSPWERSQVLDRVAALLRERAGAMGETLALESGKLRAEAVAEINFSAVYFEWFAEEARRLEQAVVKEGRSTGPQVVLQRPAGVAASLTPWNFPVSIQARKVAPALAAGCTVVARPSEQAPHAVLDLFACLQEAGVPAGAVNLLTGPAAAITEPILADPRVRVVSFTGSTAVGKSLYEGSAGTMKKLALELGGAAPFVVCDDADLERALEHAMLAKFRNCGQSCIGANCFYVQGAVYEEFLAGMVARVGALRPGDPLAEGTTLGPLINVQRREAIEEWLERATAGGVEQVGSAPALDDGGELSPDCFLPAPVLAAPALDRLDPALLHHEVFGPVVTVVGWSDQQELLAHLAANRLGLAAYVFSGDISRAGRIAMSLEVGLVGVNEGLSVWPNTPMGGMKDSGLGREGGHMGLQEFLEYQYLGLGERPVEAWGLR